MQLARRWCPAGGLPAESAGAFVSAAADMNAHTNLQWPFEKSLRIGD